MAAGLLDPPAGAASATGASARVEPSTDPAQRGRHVTIRGRAYPLVGPKLRDPRIALSLVILALQVLGQTVLHFNVSITQILVAILTCAVLEIVLVAVERKVIAWPASAMQTGSGIGFILRVPGTHHGDWWSTRGWYLFAACALFSVLSKYAIRVGDRHLFNPSNLGLVAFFVVLQTKVVDPQDLWWGPLRPPVIAALAVIAIGGLMVTRRAHVLRVTMSFYLPFCATLGVLAASGHCMTARWSATPICGLHYWWVVVTSPEIMVFILFMITDPRTVPKGPTGRTAFGVTIAVLATLIAAPMHTEFGTKVGILAALVLACALRPLFERYLPVGAPAWTSYVRRALATPRRVAVLTGVTALLALAIVGAGIPARHQPASALGSVSGASGPRPTVHVPIPPLTIGSVAEVAGKVDPATARKAARDGLDDLAIEALAVRTGQPAVAAHSTYGPRLATIRAAARREAAGAPAPVTTYQPDHVTVLYVSGTGGAQAPPQMAITVFGTATTQSYQGGKAVGPPTVDRHFSRTFLVAQGPGAYIIVGDEAAVGSRAGHPI